MQVAQSQNRNDKVLHARSSERKPSQLNKKESHSGHEHLNSPNRLNFLENSVLTPEADNTCYCKLQHTFSLVQLLDSLIYTDHS